MKYNLSNNLDRNKIIVRLEKLIDGGKQVELKEVKETRSQKQNRALHVFFTIISYQLNDLGLEFNYTGLNIDNVSTRYTPNIVKEFFWRPIQVAMFDIKSTTKIDTKQINEVTDVVVKFFGDRGVSLDFPSIESLINEN